MKRAIIHAAMAVMGRRNLARLGRLISNEARFDVPNAIGTNGERLVQEVALRHASGMANPVVFDVGANVGKWTRSLFHSAGASTALRVHLFEPCRGTYDELLRNLSEAGLQERTEVTNCALSSQEGTTEFHTVEAGSGRNSIYRVEGTSAVDTVTTRTIDSYCREKSIGEIALLKIDTEGHDMEVLSGATGMLEAQRIKVLQFEYNWRWIGARHYLADAFALLKPLGYELGKITPKGIEFYTAWHFELETFREANFVAVVPDVRSAFPQLQWWNESVLQRS